MIDSVQAYKNLSIPLDTQWSDIDYLDNYKDFTYDKMKFGDLPTFVQNLTKDNMHFIPIVDLGIAKVKSGNYSAYDDGVANDVFLKTGDGKENFVGQVWPGDSVFPDFFTPRPSLGGKPNSMPSKKILPSMAFGKT